MALTNCPNCGKQISDRAVKCPHCGFVPGSSQDEQPTSSSDQPQQEAASKKTRKKWWIIPIVVMGILAIALPLWFFSNKEKPVSETPKTEVVKTYPSPYNTYYSGTIGTARGCLTIDKNGKGSYTYDCNGTDLTRNISVVSYNEKTGQLMIKSFNNSGEYVGMFDGYLDNTRLFSGTFTNYKGGTVGFRLLAESKNNHASTSAFEFLMKKDAGSYSFTNSDLASLSPKELSYLRNHIYAIHGYVFKSHELTDYFSQFSWYHPDPSVTSSVLNSTEKANAEFIKKYQEENGKTYQLDSEFSERRSNYSSIHYVVIDGSELRLRLGPSLSSDTYKWGDGTNRHPKVGEKFKYLGESGDFYQIDFHGHRLWVSKLYTHIE